MIRNGTVNIFNDNVMAYFIKILKHRQRQQRLDKFVLKRTTTPKQVLLESKIQGIVVEEYKEFDFPEVIVEEDSPSKQ